MDTVLYELKVFSKLICFYVENIYQLTTEKINKKIKIKYKQKKGVIQWK